MSINSSVFLRPPPQRPSNAEPLSSISSEIALSRFQRERHVLQLQLQECEALQKTLYEVRRKRKQGQNTLSSNSELAEGFFMKTEILDTESFIVSLGLEESYVELELEEAIAYSQRREQYLRVALERMKDRIQGLEAELKMDMAQIEEILQRVRQ